MNGGCHEFQQWLERLPRRELAPTFNDHLRSCRPCQLRYRELEPVAELLRNSPALLPMSAADVATVSRIAVREAALWPNALISWRLGLAGVVCLPLMIVINWLWGSLGYELLVAWVSPLAAQIYLAMFISTALGLGGLTYGSLPLLAGFLRGQPAEDMQ